MERHFILSMWPIKLVALSVYREVDATEVKVIDFLKELAKQ